jgi:hypothetical protein
MYFLMARCMNSNFTRFMRYIPFAKRIDNDLVFSLKRVLEAWQMFIISLCNGHTESYFVSG